MMLGEIEYDGLFQNDCDEEPCPEVLFPGTSHVLVGCFILMISMVLMNVLFGMAVADIQVNIERGFLNYWGALETLQQLLYERKLKKRFSHQKDIEKFKKGVRP